MSTICYSFLYGFVRLSDFNSPETTIYLDKISFRLNVTYLKNMQ